MPKPEKTAKYLHEGLIDLEVGVVGEMGTEIRLTALYRDKFVGVVRKGHPLEQDREITAAKYTQLQNGDQAVRPRQHSKLCDRGARVQSTHLQLDV